VNSRTPRPERRSRSSSRRRGSSHASAARQLTREERKQHTRRAIVEAALRLLADHSFSGLSLREVAREAGIVPGAFYRHFDSMEALGLALIDESFRALREMLRRARAEQLATEHVIARSVTVLSTSVSEQRLHWRFIARERSSGVSVLRYAIRAEIRLITSELAVDLARFPALADWTSEDLGVLAGLFVNAMVSIAEALGETDDPAALEEIHRTAEKQLRMIVIGVRDWRSV
jgi:AcrR family transcriptional regulator